MAKKIKHLGMEMTEEEHQKWHNGHREMTPEQHKASKTECCDQWICDDEDQYVLFSYARNSCYRNHSRYTLCGFHFAEGHSGDWKNCQECKNDIMPEMYVYYGTNEYNFETLRDIPDYEPTLCSKCNAVIVLSVGGYSSRGDEYFCAQCTDFDWSKFKAE